jgi:hypothetical protein
MDKEKKQELIEQLRQLREEYCKQYSFMDMFGFCHPKSCKYRADCPMNVYDNVGQGWCSILLLISCLDRIVCGDKDCPWAESCRYPYDCESEKAKRIVGLKEITGKLDKGVKH